MDQSGKKFACGALIMAAGLTLFMLAKGTAGAEQASPCAADFKQFCKDVAPGSGRLLACYENQKGKMSAGCRAWAEGAKDTAASLKSVCSKEINQACNFEKGDPLEMLGCLQRQYVGLSRECAEKLNEFKYHYPQVNPQ